MSKTIKKQWTEKQNSKTIVTRLSSFLHQFKSCSTSFLVGHCYGWPLPLPDTAGHCRTLSDPGTWAIHCSAHFSTFQHYPPVLRLEFSRHGCGVARASQGGRTGQKTWEGTWRNREPHLLQLGTETAENFKLQRVLYPRRQWPAAIWASQENKSSARCAHCAQFNATDSRHLQTSPDSSDQSLGKFRAFPSTALWRLNARPKRSKMLVCSHKVFKVQPGNPWGKD